MFRQTIAVLTTVLLAASAPAYAQQPDTARLADTSSKSAHAPGEVITPGG